MSITKWTSLKVVADKILRDPIFIGLNYETIIDYFIDFITIVGAPDLFEEKLTIPDMVIANYRSVLPSDFVEDIQVIIDSRIAINSTDTFSTYYDTISQTVESQLIKENREYTYTIKGNYIYSSKKDGLIKMSYRSIKMQTDALAEDFGYPMLPDEPVFILALQTYIEVQFMRMLYRSGKITSQVLEEAKQSYAWAVGRYDTHSKRLTLSKMENISKMFRSILGHNNEFKSRFKSIGVK